MSHISHKLSASASVLGLAVFAVLSSTGMAAAASNTNALAYEFDNGTSWMLQKNSAALNSTVPAGTTYADAGIVMNVGQLANLAATAGKSPINVTGSNGLSDNIWISTGTSEANTPGSHLLTNPVDFAYGFDNHDGTFYMASGALAGSTVNLATLQAEYPNAEAYVWAGYVFNGSNYTDASGVHITSVNGMHTGNRTVSFVPNADGSTAVSLH